MTDRDRTSLSPDTSPSPTAHRKVAKPKQEKKVPSFLESPCHPKPAISTCKKHPINKDYPVVDDDLGLYFLNSDDAKASMDHTQWTPKADNTVPRTDEEAREVVKQLADAFKDMSQAKDTAKNAYRKRFASGEYNNWSIEACAWNILRIAKLIHTEGFNAPIYDKSIIDSISQTKLWSFQERIEWIKMVLKTSKYVAVGLMKNEKTWTTVGAPHKLYSSTLTNHKSNASRAGWIVEGRERDVTYQGRPTQRRKAGQHTSDEDINDMGTAVDMDTAMVTTPQQPKPKKPKRSATSLPAGPPGPNKRVQFAPINSYPLSEVVASPSVDYSALVPALAPAPPSVSPVGSGNDDAEMIVALYGGLFKGDETAQAPAAPGGDDTTINGDDAEAVTEDIMDVDTAEDTMDVDEKDIKDIADHAAAEETSDDAIENMTVVDSDSEADDNDLKRSPKTEIDDSDYFSDDAEDLLNICPAAAKTDLHLKGKLDALEPPLCDAATLEGARALAALSSSVAFARLMCQT